MRSAHRARGAFVLCALTLVPAGCSEYGTMPVPVGAITVSPDSVALELGDSAALSASVVDTAARPLSDRHIVWASNDPRVVTVTTDGVLRGVGAGATTVTAESGGRAATVVVTVTARFVALSAGLWHTCGLTESGVVSCWGVNAAGELGDSTLQTSTHPVRVATDEQFAAVDAGGTQVCARSTAGTAWCWGANWSAQLGIGAVDLLPHPSPLAVAGSHTFRYLVTGDRHACGVVADGATYCWGGGLSGQLGTAETSFLCQAIQEPCNRVPEPVTTATAFTALAVGDEHTCGLDRDGRAFCWGGNRYGQLGDSTVTSRRTPVAVVGGRVFETIAAAAWHTCALDTDGSAWCWGDNELSQLGGGAELSYPYPVAVEGGIVFESLTAGGSHTCGLDADGAAYCWGYNQAGELGIGATDPAGQPTAVATTLRFTTIEAGWTHTCGLATDGAAYCWGRNNTGQLGIGSGGGIRTTPTRLVGQPGG